MNRSGPIKWSGSNKRGASRDNGAVKNALEKLKLAAQKTENTMPATIDAVRSYATLGEICSALRDVYGMYEEPAF